MKPKAPESNSIEKPAEKETETQTPKEVGGLPSQPGSASVESIADNLSATMPDVQEHAIAQEEATENAKLAQFSHLKDRDGNSFDPSIHKTDKDGAPTVSAGGKLIKKPGRKAGNSAGASPKSFVNIPDSQKAPDPDAKLRMQARATGTMAANLIIQIGIVAGGEEWQPRQDEKIGLDEKFMLETAFADYFEATGKTDIPPGMALTVAVGAYALPRFTMPKTQTRVQKAGTSIKQWWANRKLKKHGLRAEKIADSNDKAGGI